MKFIKFDPALKIQMADRSPDGQNATKVFALSHEIETTPATINRGKTVHNPIIVTKSLDAITPQLCQFLISRTILKSVEIELWKEDLTHHFSKSLVIKLTDSRIASINQINQNSSSSPELMKFGEYEEISFTYEKIEWDMNGVVIASDTWFQI